MLTRVIIIELNWIVFVQKCSVKKQNMVIILWAWGWLRLKNFEINDLIMMVNGGLDTYRKVKLNCFVITIRKTRRFINSDTSTSSKILSAQKTEWTMNVNKDATWE